MIFFMRHSEELTTSIFLEAVEAVIRRNSVSVQELGAVVYTV